MGLQELAAMLDGELDGDPTGAVSGVGPIESAGPDEVSFLANSRYERYMETTAAAVVIVAADYAGPPSRAMIRCADPYFAFRQAMLAFHGFRQPHFDGVDARANVEPGAQLADGVRVGAFATVAAGTTVGEGTAIYPGAYVGPNCRIGRDCTIYPNVTLYDGTVLHDRVTIHAGSSLGHDGFGYATHDGVHHKIPQTGRVELEDDVEIGAGCTIDRAAMGATIIGAGTKFSNLIAIGHGTRMGKHCLMVAQSGLAGSVTVGNYCVFAGQSGVVGHVRLEDGVRVGAQAGVTRDVPAGQELLGSPAMPRPQARRAVLSITRLPQIRAAVSKLTRQVQALQHRLDGAKAREDDHGD